MLITAYLIKHYRLLKKHLQAEEACYNEPIEQRKHLFYRSGA